MDLEEELKQLRESGISRAKAAKAIGVTPERLKDYLEILDLDWQPRVGMGTVVINGVKDSLHNHAKALGVAPTTLRQRLDRKQDPTQRVQAMPITSEEAHHFAQLRRGGATGVEAARVIGRPAQNLRRAARKLVQDYTAFEASLQGNGHNGQDLSPSSNAA